MRQWQEVSSGLNRTFISISSSYLYQIIHINNNVVIISFFICIYTERFCSWYFLGPNDPFWFHLVWAQVIHYFLFPLYWFGNYSETKLWEGPQNTRGIPLRRINLSPTPVHLPRRQSLLAHWQWPMRPWMPGCLTNRPGNKQGIRSGLEL